ncbi:GTP pyrophosphokinase [Fusibacter sp. JL216-2]|uniref:GTP pyrophosphokinase n=1 Tax=Fusibacter sp. JL216-2 TaxID=3071453 RepID=UPI003D3533D9
MYEEFATKEMKPWRDLLLVHKFAVEEVNTKLQILDEEFRSIHDYNPIEHIKSRVKKPSSIMDKLVRYGFEPTIENARKHIFDIAGIRVICAFTSDIYKVYDLLDRQDDVRIIEVKDYIANPKDNGYKSMHVHVEIPVFLSSGVVPTRIEIQIRTIAMDFWASLEHKIYYKYRNQAPKNITDQLKVCANMITLLDDRMLDIKNEIQELDFQQTLDMDVISEIDSKSIKDVE